MWCDDFDADLPRVVPGALETLGDLADLPLTTYSRTTGGKINCPSCWSTYDGFVSFFWTAPEHRPDSYYATSDPETACTFGEAVRDEWVHSTTVNIDGHQIWTPPARLMEALMSDLRGWTRLTDDRREHIQEQVRRSLAAAVGRLSLIIGENRNA